MSAKTPEEILKGIEQDFLHMPYNKYVWMRLEFALICNDELEALILRIVEYSIEGQRLAWVSEATNLASQGKPVPPEPQWWCSFSYRQFMSYLYGVVKNEKTIIKKLTSLINKKFLLRREDPEKPYNAPQYTINKEVVQDHLNGLPKKLPTLREVAEYHSQHNQPVPPNGTPNNEENDPYQLVVPPVPASGTPRTITGDSPVPASGGEGYQQMVPNKNNKTITETKEVEEENAHVSDDNAPTPSLSSNSPSSLQAYDLLLAYRDNQLEHLYECEKAAIVNMSQKLSPNRAGELAAAKLSVQFCEQYMRFKDEVDNLARTSQQIAPEQEDLYDWMVDHWNVRADVTTLSGTRTLILDEDMYRSSLQETESTAPSDEQSSKQADTSSHSQNAKQNDTDPKVKQANTAKASSRAPNPVTAKPTRPEVVTEFANKDEQAMWARLGYDEQVFYAQWDTQARRNYADWCSLFTSRPTISQKMFDAAKKWTPTVNAAQKMEQIKDWCFTIDKKTANYPKGYYNTYGVNLWDVVEKSPTWELLQERQEKQKAKSPSTGQKSDLAQETGITRPELYRPEEDHNPLREASLSRQWIDPKKRNRRVFGNEAS